MSTLGSATVHKLNVSIPAWGDWRADVVLEGGELPAGALTLTIGSGAGALALAGHVLRADFDAPAKPHAIVTGAPGWDRLIASPISFHSDAGVRLSTVLAALASGAGETIAQPTDVTVGLHYACAAARTGEPARYRDALADLVRAGNAPPWWVHANGTTRFDARPTAEVSARATRLRSLAGVGLTVYGIDDPAAFLPGVTVEAETVTRVVFVERPGSLTVEAWT